MSWLTKTSGDRESFNWGDYRAHLSMNDWTVFKRNIGRPITPLGITKTKRQAAEVCKEHRDGKY